MIDWVNILDQYANRTLFVSDLETVTYADFYKLVQQASERSLASDFHLMEVEWTIQSFSNLLGYLHSGGSVILDTKIEKPEMEEFSEQSPLLVLKSGGTTATPRHVVHSFEIFLKPYRIRKKEPLTILILYAADHVAGLDAFFHALYSGSTIVFSKETGLDAIGNLIQKQQVDVIAATPSQLQFLLLGGLHKTHDLSSISRIPHGAERMPMPIRKAILQAFPNATLLNRFGMTELGSLPVRPDPDDDEALFLDAPGYEWKLVEGEIHVQSVTSFLGTLERGRQDPVSGWYPTGDLGELTPRGSMRILGRKESVINVGGIKILPEDVEQFLLEEVEISDAFAFPVSHAMTGQAVAAKIVSSGESNPGKLMKKLRKRALESSMPLAAVPVQVEFVASIKKSATGKRIRSAECLDLEN